MTIIHVYFIISIILLFIGSILTAKAFQKYIKYFKESNFLIRSFITPLVADTVCIINFLSRSISHLFFNNNNNNIFCQISATLAVAHFLTLFCGHLFISFCTYKMTLGKKVSNKKILIYNIIFWLFGISYGILLQSFKILGNFEGLYCCILKEQLNHILVMMITYICIIIFFFTIFFYIIAYRVVKFRRNIAGVQNIVEQIILKRGMMFFFSFIFCWSLMIYNLITKPFGYTNLKLEVEIVSAWMAKCMPIINSSILLRLFHIMEEKQKINDENKQKYSPKLLSV